MNNYNQLNDKIKGCLFGGAVGDALGYHVEFLSHPEIVSKYGDHGIQQYEFNIPCEKGKFKEAQISDDTQMTLYTVEAILKNPDSMEEILENIKKAYVIWMSKQTGIRLGAIAGNIIGAILGYKRIPQSYIVNIQNRDYIEMVSDRLTAIKKL